MSKKKACLMLFAFICLGFSAITHAGGFYSAADLPQESRPSDLDKLIKSSYRLQLNGQSCSSFFISNSDSESKGGGYLLTNLHCVDVCLFDQGILQSKGQPGLRLDISRRVGSGLVQVKCDQATLPALQIKGAVIEYVGTGFANFDDFDVARFDNNTMNLLKDVFDGDFAILKFDGVKDHRNQPSCLVPSQSETLANEPVWMASYPGAVNRPDDRGTNGISQYLSFGVLGKSIRQNQFFLKFGLDELFWQRQEFWTQQFFVANLDSAFGASGSPWVNSKTELIALNAGISGPDLRQNSMEFFAFSSLAIPIQKIRQQIDAELGENQSKKYFNCSN